ncbi:hypothetical protein HY249_00010 [Candidatus Azambacteria bacterium]|nr:hypothetical protein [Candidatus Azambacteria bacterium]
MILQISILIIFLAAVFLNAIKRNLTAVSLYAFQSLAVSAVLLYYFFENRSWLLLFVIILTFAVKSIIAPLFLSRLIKKHHLKYSASTYLNIPLTLLAVTALTVIAHSGIFSSLTKIAGEAQNMAAIAIAVILISFFLIINRKGIISQMIGVLSLENGIVFFAIFSGLEQAPGLQIGIIFNIFIWIMIASVFVSMIYRQFGTLDSTEMKLLKD